MEIEDAELVETTVNMSPIQSCMNDLTLSFPKKILISIFGGFGLIGCFNCFEWQAQKTKDGYSSIRCR